MVTLFGVFVTPTDESGVSNQTKSEYKRYELVALDNKEAVRDFRWTADLARCHQTGVQQQLQPFQAHLAGRAATDVLLIKYASDQVDQSAVAAFNGVDGQAMAAALESLGWGKANWCGVLIKVAETPTDDIDKQKITAEKHAEGNRVLTSEQLQMIIEINDPALIIGFDQGAMDCMTAALFSSAKTEQVTGPGVDQTVGQCTGQTADQTRVYPQKESPTLLRVGEKVSVNGRYLLALGDFSSSLQNDQSKQQVWAQLKQIQR
jgi:hypothetical protein